MGDLHKFEDGSVIHRDSRGEDSLIYYVPQADWSRAIGFRISPERQEWKAEQVKIKIWKDHVDRVKSLPDDELSNIVEQFTEGLSITFKRWKLCSFEWPPWLVDRVGEDRINLFMEEAGWALSTDSGPYQWTRVRVISPPKRWWQIWK